LLDIKFRRQSSIRFTNVLRTTRSTFTRLAKGGSASPKTMWPTLVPKKNKKKAGHPFKYLICPAKPQENRKKENTKVLTRFWRFGYKGRLALKFHPNRTTHEK
jgi:hypothetical protein